ncbi:hypothetical protein P7K49_011885, partial [Saguinus oedipus]
DSTAWQNPKWLHSLKNLLIHELVNSSQVPVADALVQINALRGHPENDQVAFRTLAASVAWQSLFKQEPKARPTEHIPSRLERRPAPEAGRSAEVPRGCSPLGPQPRPTGERGGHWLRTRNSASSGSRELGAWRGGGGGGGGGAGEGGGGGRRGANSGAGSE